MKRRTRGDYLAFEYPIELRALPPEEGGGWLACIPSLGRHSFRATGETQEEALKDLAAVKRLLIEDMYSRGEQLPDPPPLDEDYSGTPGLRMAKTLHGLAAQRAREEGVSLNLYFNTLIAQGLGVDMATQAVHQELVPLRLEVQSLAARLPMIVYEFQPVAGSLPADTSGYQPANWAQFLEVGHERKKRASVGKCA